MGCAPHPSPIDVIFRFLLTRTRGDHEMAEDVTQETYEDFIIYWDRRHLRDEEVLPILFTIAKRRLVDRFRKNKRTLVSDDIRIRIRSSASLLVSRRSSAPGMESRRRVTRYSSGTIMQRLSQPDE
jgi:DNA-directed RNA polymerase specialized sigma24 family protein